MTYFNIHTHHQPLPGEWALQNIHQDFAQALPPRPFSMGLHPWYLSHLWRQHFAELQQYAAQSQVLAIGECGLDKVCTTDFALQQEVFELQVRLANECRKPLIIHCVKAYDELLQLLKPAKVAVVFHGFNKSKELAWQLVAAGHYLSFGKALLHGRGQEVLGSLPPDRIFLETDDAGLPIAALYKIAANACGLAEDLLSLQLEKNVSTVFNYKG